MAQQSQASLSGASSVKVNSLTEKIGQFLFPEKIRGYLTFRAATVFVVMLASLSFTLTRLDESAPPPEATAWNNRILSVVHSPAFLIFYNICLALGFWSVYATRAKAKYYWLRVVVYAMLLGSLLGEIISFLPPPHHP
jgi:hydrogenase/urease accessory protein HupE